MKIAVVIPALDEEAGVVAAIASTRAPVEATAVTAVGTELGTRPGTRVGSRIGPEAETEVGTDVEVVVVDGGSRDATCRLAREAGARVLRSGPGRARQLQAGVRATAGDPILFLHADTRLPPGWYAGVRRALRDPDVVGGAFALRFDSGGARLRAVARMASWRSRWLGLPYGDQALFVRRDVLGAIGGVPDVPLMEDVDLVMAMRSRGRLVILHDAVQTSPRRYLAGGVARTVLRHTLALGAWRMGVDRGRIARWLGR